MKKTFIKNPAYIGGIITLLSIITISLLFAVALIVVRRRKYNR